MRCSPPVVTHVDPNAFRVGTATLHGRADIATGALQRQRPNHSLADDNSCDLVFHKGVVMEEMKSNAHPNAVHTSDDVPPTLTHM